MFIHVYVWSRNDTNYACTCLAWYIQLPSTASIEGLCRIACFIATHCHRPVWYQRLSIDGVHTIWANFVSPKFEEIMVLDGFIFVVDSDHARDTCTQRSCHHVQGFVHSVVVDWKHEQQKCVSLHSTDSEIRGVFSCTKRGLYLQQVDAFIGISSDDSLPTPIYEDSQPCIDTLEENTVTS